MSDDTKQQSNTNTDDDLNLDFDIMLDPNEEPSKPKEETNQIQQLNQESGSDLNFDIDTPPKPNKPKELIPKVVEIQKEIPASQIGQQELPQETSQILPQQASIEATEVKEEKPVIETPTEQTPPTQQTEIKENEPSQSEKEIIQASTNYNPDISAAHETIQQLQEAREQGKQNISSNELNEMPTVQTTDAKIIQQETENKQTPISPIVAGAINLDDILSPPESTTESKPENPIQETPQVQFPQSVVQEPNPYNIPTQTANQTQAPINNGEHKKHLIMIIGIVAVCVLAGFFILKTMYPMQFGSDKKGSGEIPTPVEQPIPPQEETPPTDILFTGENTESTGTQDSIEELTGNSLDLSGNIQEHDASENTDPFQDLDNLQNQDEQKKQATIDSLKDFASKGQYYLDMGKEKGVKNMIKYGVYLTGKANGFINQIEKGEILDISSLDSYLAQFSISLQKLQDLENAPDTTTQQSNNTPQEDSGFNQTGTQEVPLDGSTGENTAL